MSKRNAMIEVAMKYIDALVSKDPTGVPFADNAIRFEQGHPDCDSPDEIRERLQASAMDAITGRGPVRWIVEEESGEAVGFLELELAPSGTCRMAERFRIKDGLIEEIEALFTIDGLPRSSDDSRTVSQRARVEN
jgi:hypothetical protein